MNYYVLKRNASVKIYLYKDVSKWTNIYIVYIHDVPKFNRQINRSDRGHLDDKKYHIKCCVIFFFYEITKNLNTEKKAG